MSRRIPVAVIAIAIVAGPMISGQTAGNGAGRADDLAARLAGVPDRAAGSRLLDENQDLLGAELATSLLDRGRQARNGGDRPLAQRLYELSFEVGERAGLPVVRALALNNVGLVNYDIGNYPEALDWYKRSLAISEPLGDDRAIARTLNNIGVVYSDTGELETAADYFERCLTIGERLKDPRVISNALNNLALGHGRRGDYVSALALLQRSFAMDEPTGDKRSLSASLLNLGNVYLWQGDYLLAEDHFRRALSFADDANVRSLTAIAYMNLGRVAEFRGDLPAALRDYTRSLSICEEIDDKPYAAAVLSFLGSAHLTVGDTSSSLTFFQRSVDLHRSIGASAELPLALTGLAAAYNRAGRADAALAAAREAGELARNINAREAIWRAHLEAGKARLAAGAAADGERELVDAIATVESLRFDVVGGEFERQSFFANKLEPYHRLVALLVEAGRAGDALQYAERAKARVLVDVFSAARPQPASVMTEDERAADEGFRIRLASLNARLGQERQGTEGRGRALAAEIDRARLDYSAFQSLLFARHPQLKAQRGEIDPVGVADLGRSVGNGRALLEFVVADDCVYAFTITPGVAASAVPAVHVVKTTISSSELARRVRDFQTQIARRDLGFRRSAADLYQLLVAPVRGSLSQAQTLTIVPDAALWELPFQALVSSDGRFLLDEMAVSYAPSLTTLMLMTDRKDRLESGRQAPRLLAMGNPAWDARARNRAAATYRDADLGSLELAETEVSRLAAIYGAARSRVYVRGQATERRFKLEAGDRQILHIATHGILNDASPLYSHVLLAPSAAGGPVEDGLLEAWELLQMKLQAELVVLSACETARGRVTAGEGTIGLSWALFVAGVPTTVLSQWKADSASTTDLMLAFHRNLRRGLDEARAMRAAALSVRSNPAYAHPVYWAPFIVIGASQPSPSRGARR